MQNIVSSVSRALNVPTIETFDNSLSLLDNRTGKTFSLPIERDSIKATDLKQAGLKILDQGYLNTACVESSITHIDGKAGTIHYREHSLDAVVRNNDWEEVVYLLNWGYLPTSVEKTAFRRALASAMQAPQTVKDVIQAFPRDALTSSLITAGLSAYTTLDPGAQKVHTSGRAHYVGNMVAVDSAIVRTLSALATTIALAYCHKRGRTFTPPDANGSFIGNLLLMMGFVDEHGRPDKKCEKCFEKLWILYADHEMTNSTAAFLHASSTLTDPISAITSGIVSAYGPLHGAAIDMAYHGFEEMGSPEGVPRFIEGVKAGKQRLFGYGHRIYRTTDPRAKHIRAMMDEHKDLVYGNDMLKIAMEVDRIASSDEFFVSRNLKANADLYGCFLYTAMGFEADIIVAMASLSRAGGVLAHWREAMQEKPQLWRPQQVYTGALRRVHGAKL